MLLPGDLIQGSGPHPGGQGLTGEGRLLRREQGSLHEILHANASLPSCFPVLYRKKTFLNRGTIRKGLFLTGRF
jgi:hypothetical protein